MTKEPLCHLDVEGRGSLLIARLDGGPLAQSEDRNTQKRWTVSDLESE